MASLAIIPARGGSKGIPRKNLQPIGNDLLITRAIHNCRDAGANEVIVTTDDPTIAAISLALGAMVRDRPALLADDHAVLADVVFDAWDWFNDTFPGSDVNEVIVWEPTAPVVSARHVGAFAGRTNLTARSVIFVEPVHGITWVSDRPYWEQITPRVNRQEQEYARHAAKELGVFITHRALLDDHEFLGPDPVVFVTEGGPDIDTPLDLAQARAVDQRWNIEVHPLVGQSIGLGHMHRAMTLADALHPHHVALHADGDGASWANEVFAQRGYSTDDAWPDVVVLDRLDTDRALIEKHRARNPKVLIVSLEDLGEGARHADLVVNELYDKVPWPHRGFFGPRYAVLRPEFVAWREHRFDPMQSDYVLVSFGGTDPARLTEQTVQALLHPLNALGIELRVVMPPARDDVQLPLDDRLHVLKKPDMAAQLAGARLVVTSAGRTVHEAACVGAPTISIAVNRREHEHARVPGVTYLGPHWQLNDAALLRVVMQTVTDERELMMMHRRAMNAVDGKGTRRVVRAIEDMVEGL